jgi:hypothetical protein
MEKKDGETERWREGGKEKPLIPSLYLSLSLSLHPSIPPSLYPSIPLSLHPSL